jgi:hypothetical protein
VEAGSHRCRFAFFVDVVAVIGRVGDTGRIGLLRGLERRLARLGGRSPKPVEPIMDAGETPDLSK